MLNEAHRETSQKSFSACLQQVITQNVSLIITNTRKKKNTEERNPSESRNKTQKKKTNLGNATTNFWISPLYLMLNKKKQRENKFAKFFAQLFILFAQYSKALVSQTMSMLRARTWTESVYEYGVRLEPRFCDFGYAIISEWYTELWLMGLWCWNKKEINKKSFLWFYINFWR